MRIITFIFLFFVALISAPLVTAACMMFYAFSYVGYELLIIAVSIDAYFGSSAGLPYYTCLTLTLLLIAEVVKPRLSFYTS